MPLSPNHGPRRLGARPDLVVIHYTAMESHDAALARLCDPAAEVSAHWLISGAGTVTKLVPEALRAWHAGAGRWGAVGDVNSRSIGIELYNCGDHPFAGPQMAALEELLAGVMTRWQIPPERIIGHSDMAPGRKDDPGPRFDWQRLARRGLSVWPVAGREQGPVAASGPAAFDDLAKQFGYTADVTHAQRLAAFRLRFRPRATGPVDAADMALIADLAHRFPVDRTAPAP
ncbi:N-acetylmuramoyl-L-alanine amidase [Limimaricola hongkongensis]|uniref:N-acetylmuramoyl-L-alanine amidase n=1 Tax=Limimaricola hongkongensis DSM 17492 TaxID=1122180 RepID=A0A017HEY6_9RHOB|nr:N-acetylmuramoyl-L-alanine amidase [Limimaricola hongkongensis]EYD72713.1 N-acetylmuramoyl-L-alanine amidase [Limimaricola hongkongensis DSM 17492]